MNQHPELDRWIAAAEREPRDSSKRARAFRAGLFLGVSLLCLIGLLLARSCS